MRRCTLQSILSVLAILLALSLLILTIVILTSTDRLKKHSTQHLADVTDASQEISTLPFFLADIHVPCDAGYVATEQPEVCEPCPEDTYSDKSLKACISCPSDTHSIPGSWASYLCISSPPTEEGFP